MIERDIMKKHSNIMSIFVNCASLLLLLALAIESSSALDYSRVRRPAAQCFADLYYTISSLFATLLHATAML